MKWLSLVLTIVLILTLVVVPASVVSAGSVVDITLFVTPLFGAGILSFTITYVTETQLDLDWVVGANVSSVMIRAKYGQYPNDIADNATAPSDGYLVYSGNLTHFSDTSMNFDQNAGPLYYRAWAQLNDGSWVITPKQGWKESAIMTLLAVFGLAAALSFLAYRSVNYGMKVAAAIGWVGALMYWLNNRPSAITQGSAPDVVVMFALGTASFVFLTWPWFVTKQNGNEVGAGFRISMDRLLGREEPPPRRSPSRADRIAAYQERLSRADRGEREY